VTREEKIEKLRNLTKAYILYSLYTRVPFVECEQANFYDQAFLFETKEDAEEAAKRMYDNGDPVGITELKIVDLPRPEGAADNVVPMRRLMRNQVRENLTKFPLFGINAVFFKPAEDRGESLPLDDVLPEEVKAEVNKEQTELVGLKLTGLYFAQYIRRNQKDVQLAKERYEEFYANLARAQLLLPVIPEEAHRDDPSLNLTKCMLPIYTPHDENGDVAKADGEAQKAEGEDKKPKISALGLFTNMDEVVVHSRNHLKEVRVVRVAMDQIRNFVPEHVEYVVIDPLTMSITLKVDDVVKVIKEIRGEEPQA
jgi:hypothetical protein